MLGSKCIESGDSVSKGTSVSNMFPSQSCKTRYKRYCVSQDVSLCFVGEASIEKGKKNCCSSGAWLAESNNVEQIQMEMLWVCSSVRKLTAQRSNRSVNGLDKDALMGNLTIEVSNRVVT
jgi:hypothetical protein